MRIYNILYGLLVIVTFLTTSCLQKKLLPYQNEKLSVEERVNDLVSRMTLDEKIKMVSGYKTFYTYPVPRLNIPSLKMADISGGEGKSTAFPLGVSLAAAWDTSLVNQIGKGFGTEFRAKGKNVALSPCVNIQRFAGGGRNFESYGEDPYLASRMAVSFIKGIQSE